MYPAYNQTIFVVTLMRFSIATPLAFRPTIFFSKKNKTVFSTALETLFYIFRPTVAFRLTVPDINKQPKWWLEYTFCRKFVFITYRGHTELSFFFSSCYYQRNCVLIEYRAFFIRLQRRISVIFGRYLLLFFFFPFRLLVTYFYYTY